MKNKGSKIILTIVFVGILVFGASFARAQTSNEDIIKTLQSLVQVLMQMVTQLQAQVVQKLTPSTILNTKTTSTTVLSPITTTTMPTSVGNTITINRALTLELIEDLPNKKVIKAIDSNLQNLYKIIITPKTKLKIGSITDGGDWLIIGLPKLNTEPKTWYDLEWNKFPKMDSAIIKVNGTIIDTTCYIYVDADTVYFYSVNIDPGCPFS